ncbi:hypothetical protein EVJ58_g3194 [Rhodofomes roseus]|uniref:Amino acid transporter n=1 Tax=Rhodofomes roseus TaxID=34475 RepID=A0A4Y9YM19_9APHY|nr:hypothetical protein EVJ58_g3194 [Rhodofomes roseus]
MGVAEKEDLKCKQADEDALELARLGYKQEFKRAFSPLQVFGLVFSIFGLFPSIASVLVYALPYGGPVAMVWGWGICSFFLLLITLSLAELGSAAPTSGGLYYWSFKFASPRWRRLLSWIVGFAKLQTFYVVLNVLLCLAIIIALPAATPSEFKNSASYAFTGFVNYSGWPDGFAFVLSFLAPLWTISGFDSSLHITGILGWAINVVLAFCMGTDIENIMNSPIGQPMAVILYNSLGQKGTLAVWSVVVAVQFMMGTSTLLASSRQTFAFARDGGLPFSGLLYRIHPRTQTPIACAWAAAFVAALLGLLAFAGDAAISAIFALGVVGLYIAYIIPICSRFAGGRAWVPGPFTLGRFGFPVAVISLLWMVFSIIILVFPSSPAPDAPDMNYTVVVLAAWLALCLVYYYLPVYGGVHWFRGPIANVNVDSEDSDEVGDVKNPDVAISVSSIGTD